MWWFIKKVTIALRHAPVGGGLYIALACARPTRDFVKDHYISEHPVSLILTSIGETLVVYGENRIRGSNMSKNQVGLDRPPIPAPRWVKVFGIIGIVLVLLVVIIMYTGLSGEHGPGRHLRSGAPAGHTPPIPHRVQ